MSEPVSKGTTHQVHEPQGQQWQRWPGRGGRGGSSDASWCLDRLNHVNESVFNREEEVDGLESEEVYQFQKLINDQDRIYDS